MCVTGSSWKEALLSTALPFPLFAIVSCSSVSFGGDSLVSTGRRILLLSWTSLS